MRYPRYILSPCIAKDQMDKKGFPYFKMGDPIEAQIQPNIWVDAIFWNYSLKEMAYYYDQYTTLRKTKPQNVRLPKIRKE